MRFTGVDLSLRQTGIARADDTFVTMTPLARLEGYWRHDDVARRLLELVEEDNPDLVVFEDYAPHSPGINSTIAAAEIGGVVRRDLTRRGFAFIAIKPNVMKLYATGHGNASKAQVFDAALANFSLNADVDDRPANYDEADAYWLRSMAKAHYGRRSGMERAGVLERVEWPELVRA